MRPQDTAYIIERLAVRFMAMVADHEAKMVEHRAAFGVRTEADAKIIAGLREERDGLLTQVQDMRAEMERLQMEVAALKSQTPKPCDQPVTVKREPKVGDTVQLVKRPTKQDYELSWLDDWGKVGESFRAVSGVCTYNKTPSVLVEIRGKNYSWPLSCVEVVTEATHDTEAGKAAAESVIRNDRKTEPDEIKVGDVAKVRSASGNLTAKCDVGQIGEVLKIDSRDGTVLLSGEAGWVDIQDVRKVTT